MNNELKNVPRGTFYEFCDNLQKTDFFLPNKNCLTDFYVKRIVFNSIEFDLYYHKVGKCFLIYKIATQEFSCPIDISNTKKFTNRDLYKKLKELSKFVQSKLMIEKLYKCSLSISFGSSDFITVAIIKYKIQNLYSIIGAVLVEFNEPIIII